MAKKIIQIGSISFGNIYLNKTMYELDENPTVESIEYREGELTLSHLGHSLCNKESYIVHFENSTKTLEVFDVNYVIRDEE